MDDILKTFVAPELEQIVTEVGKQEPLNSVLFLFQVLPVSVHNWLDYFGPGFKVSPMLLIDGILHNKLWLILTTFGYSKKMGFDPSLVIWPTVPRLRRPLLLSGKPTTRAELQSGPTTGST